MGDLIINPPISLLNSSMDKGPRYTEFSWAARLDPVVYPGYNALVTFSNGYKRMMFSNGVKWKLEEPWYSGAPGVSITGTTADTPYLSTIIPGGLMGADGSIVLRIHYDKSGTNGALTMNGKLGSTWVMQYPSSSAAQHGITYRTVTNTSETAQRMVSTSTLDQSINSTNRWVASENTKNDLPFVLSATLASGSDIFVADKVILEII
jgi:hypothetical protein